MQTVYETRITRIGKMAYDFIEDRILVLFGNNAPIDVAEYCLLITMNEIKGGIHKGDILQLGEKEYRITSVGNKVEKNLEQLGHITLQFDGRESKGLPGTLYLENTEIHEPVEGGVIKVIKK